jgi:hypothetical protein
MCSNIEFSLEVTPCSLAGSATGPQGFTSENIAVLVVTAMKAPRPQIMRNVFKACGFTYTYFSPFQQSSCPYNFTSIQEQ